MRTRFVSKSPDETLKAGEELGRSLAAGDLVLLTGDLGAGKTLFTKGIVQALGFDVDEVTSPSFTLVNLYVTERYNVYHIDLWRLDTAAKPAEAVGLEEILENPNAVTIIEWAERLGEFSTVNHTIRVTIDGDGEEPRRIEITRTQPIKAKS
jgi:tRNA threonylcarbamoyladenosine biosynthesis protein TsaE